MLEVRLGDRARTLAELFPHLYDSPLFAWYQPPGELSAALAEALAPKTPAEPSELLGWLYQFSISETVRKRFGHFYTPRPVVRSMLDNVGFSDAHILETRVIDPACGAGAFLVEGTRRVLDAAREARLGPAETCMAVQRVVHGLDVNPLGVLLAEAAIALLLAPHLARAGLRTKLEPLHLCVTDTLRAGELRAESHADAVADIKNREGAYQGGFDFVVANPPYAKRPSRLMTEEQRRRFAVTTYGHANLYGLFLQAGVELLAEGGRLAFINPKSFVSGLYFRNLRRFLDQRLDLECFDTFEKRTGLFEGVLQDVVILSATKREPRSPTIALREFAGPPDSKPSKAIRVPRSSVLLGEHFDHAFFISADELAHRLLAKMRNEGVSLSRLGFEAVTGTIVWNRLKRLVRNEPGDDALPLIWGHGIRAFRFVGLGNRAGEATHMALAPETEQIISCGPALLVKRMTAKEEPRRLVAARVPDELARNTHGYFAENHVNLLRASDDAAIELDTVLGLLNSRLYDYVFRALNGNTQVSATELEMLPIRQGPELAQIAEQARALTHSGGEDSHAWPELDRLAYRLYELGEDDIAELEGTAPLALAG